jgi:hypothetical protein
LTVSSSNKKSSISYHAPFVYFFLRAFVVKEFLFVEVRVEYRDFDDAVNWQAVFLGCPANAFGVWSIIDTEEFFLIFCDLGMKPGNTKVSVATNYSEASLSTFFGDGNDESF